MFGGQILQLAINLTIPKQTRSNDTISQNVTRRHWRVLRLIGSHDYASDSTSLA